jgi:hypothetical protein
MNVTPITHLGDILALHFQDAKALRRVSQDV